MVSIPFFTWFYTSQVVQDFFHQQYLVSLVVVFLLKQSGIQKVKCKGKIHRFCHGFCWTSWKRKIHTLNPKWNKFWLVVFFTNPICKIWAKKRVHLPQFSGWKFKKKHLSCPPPRKQVGFGFINQSNPRFDPTTPNHLGREQESTHFSSQFACPYRLSQICSVERKAQGLRIQEESYWHPIFHLDLGEGWWIVMKDFAMFFNLHLLKSFRRVTCEIMWSTHGHQLKKACIAKANQTFNYPLCQSPTAKHQKSRIFTIMKAYTEQHKDATNPSTSLSTHIPWLTPITRGKQKFSPRNTDGLIIKVVPSLFPGLDLRPFGAWNK